MKTLAEPGAREELRLRLHALRPDRGPRWGRMSVHQMVCHLADAFGMGLGERAVSRADHLLNRTVVKWVALYAPLPWPRGVLTTRPEVDPLRGGTRPTEFRRDMARVDALMERFVAQGGRLDRTPHPLFGRMSNDDWLRWGWLHTDHHLRQFGG